MAVEKTCLPSASNLVEGPGAVRSTGAEVTPELLVDLLADVDVVLGTSHALVTDSGGGGLAIGVDGDGLATHGVAVGLSTHLHVRDGDNVSSLILAGIVLTASTHTDGVVGELTGEGAASRAASVVLNSINLVIGHLGRRGLGGSRVGWGGDDGGLSDNDGLLNLGGRLDLRNGRSVD